VFFTGGGGVIGISGTMIGGCGSTPCGGGGNGGVDCGKKACAGLVPKPVPIVTPTIAAAIPNRIIRLNMVGTPLRGAWGLRS
jgi:hypothetical protein